MTDIASVSVGSDPDVIVVEISGEVDLSNAPELTAALLEAVPNSASGMVVDISKVEYIDSAGLRMFVELGRRLQWRQQTLRIVAPEGSRPRRVMSLAGAETSLPFDPDVEVARSNVLLG